MCACVRLYGCSATSPEWKLRRLSSGAPRPSPQRLELVPIRCRGEDKLPLDGWATGWATGGLGNYDGANDRHKDRRHYGAAALNKGQPGSPKMREAIARYPAVVPLPSFPLPCSCFSSQNVTVTLGSPPRHFFPRLQRKGDWGKERRSVRPCEWERERRRALMIATD